MALAHRWLFVLITAAFVAGCDFSRPLPPAGPTRLETSLASLAAPTNELQRCIDLWISGDDDAALRRVRSIPPTATDELRIERYGTSSRQPLSPLELEDVVNIDDLRAIGVRSLIQTLLGDSQAARNSGDAEGAAALCALVRAIADVNRRARSSLLRQSAEHWIQEVQAACPLPPS
ncbi:MAG: hypothetical protein SGJ09_17135 [Phycisphaerae bacterium]|nr:hypothetical protein [Phycisphaerae bacterium]